MSDENHPAIAIVLPATFPGSVEDSHCTVIFLGRIVDATFTKDQVLNAMYEMEQRFGNFERRFAVTGTDWFGVGRDIPVMRIQGNWLRYYRKIVDILLAEEGIRSASEWEYEPHVTLPMDYALDIPHDVTLTKPVLWWGNER